MHHRINVVRVFSRLNIGGPSIHVILLTAGLNPARFESMLLVGREDVREGNMYYLAERYGVKPVVVPSLGREISIWNDLCTILTLWRLMRQKRPHIVHTHTSKAGFSGRIAARLAGVPVVVHTFHGHVLSGYFGRLKSGLFVWLERRLARWSDSIITVSQRLKEELLERRIAPADKIRVVELGLDLEPFLSVRGRSGVLRSELHVAAEVPLIGIVGRMVPIKDHRTFLKAASAVCRRMPAVRFAVIGDGELRDALEALAGELGLKERVHFTGWRRDLPAIYADLDLVVLSSKNEGTPVSLIEGSAAGRPVVATSVGGVPDFITDGWNGLLVPQDAPEALADAMVRILEDPETAAAFSARGRERVRERYGAARLLADLERLYLNLLAQKGIFLQEAAEIADGMAVQ